MQSKKSINAPVSGDAAIDIPYELVKTIESDLTIPIYTDSLHQVESDPPFR